MKILDCSDIGVQQVSGSVVTIGNFDGVHRGHAELFNRLNECGKRFGLPTVVVTFEPHPLTVLAPESAPPLITTFSQKIELIAQTGIDYLAVIQFTRAFSQISAETFVRKLLRDSLGMRHIIIGHDYGFGRGRAGNYETLDGMAVECGFSIEDLEPVGSDGVIYSSSLVRRQIADGDLSGASATLGRYHTIAGPVVHGREIGQKIGFPTANIATENELIPPDGVYAVFVTVGDQLVQGACNIGKNLTFDGAARTIEVFLLDFSGQLYDCILTVSFVQRLRDGMRFPSAEALITAINKDVADTRTILANTDRDLIKPLTGRAIGVLCEKGC